MKPQDQQGKFVPQNPRSDQKQAQITNVGRLDIIDSNQAPRLNLKAALLNKSMKSRQIEKSPKRNLNINQDSSLDINKQKDLNQQKDDKDSLMQVINESSKQQILDVSQVLIQKATNEQADVAIELLNKNIENKAMENKLQDDPKPYVNSENQKQSNLDVSQNILIASDSQQLDEKLNQNFEKSKLSINNNNLQNQAAKQQSLDVSQNLIASSSLQQDTQLRVDQSKPQTKQTKEADQTQSVQAKLNTNIMQENMQEYNQFTLPTRQELLKQNQEADASSKTLPNQAIPIHDQERSEKQKAETIPKSLVFRNQLLVDESETEYLQSQMRLMKDEILGLRQDQKNERLLHQKITEQKATIEKQRGEIAGFIKKELNDAQKIDSLEGKLSALQAEIQSLKIDYTAQKQKIETLELIQSKRGVDETEEIMQLKKLITSQEKEIEQLKEGSFRPFNSRNNDFELSIQQKQMQLKIQSNEIDNFQLTMQNKMLSSRVQELEYEKERLNLLISTYQYSLTQNQQILGLKQGLLNAEQAGSQLHISISQMEK